MCGRHKRIAIDYGTDNIMDSLSSDLVHLILDHMPIRDAARTSILSKKWRYVWSEHPHLVFDNQFFIENFRREEPPDSWVDAITGILFLHIGPVLKFSLYIPFSVCSYIHLDKHIHKWLLHLSRNGIQEITLDMSSSYLRLLPFNIFSYPEVKRFNVKNFIFRPPTSFGGLCNLSSVHLTRIAFTPELFRNRVPNAPLLKRLVFEHCFGIEHFKVDAPKLKAFMSVLSGQVKPLSFHNNPDLNSVTIVLPERTTVHGQGGTINLSEFLDKFPSPKRVRFNRWFLKLLDAGTVPVMFDKPLNSLTHIRLHDFQFSDRHQMSFLLSLLRSSPNLTRLVIWASAEESNGKVQDVNCWNELDFINHRFKALKTVGIYGVDGLGAELHFIKFILATSPLLETMGVSYRRLSKRLLLFDWLSRKAKPVHVFYNRNLTPDLRGLLQLGALAILSRCRRLTESAIFYFISLPPVIIL